MKTHATDMTLADMILLEKIPKAVLYAVAKHLAAQVSPDGYDTAIASDAARDGILAEWATLHENGIVPQKPIKADTLKARVQRCQERQEQRGY